MKSCNLQRYSSIWVILLTLINSNIIPGQAFALRPPAHEKSQAQDIGEVLKTSSSVEMPFSRKALLKTAAGIVFTIMGIRGLQSLQATPQQPQQEGIVAAAQLFSEAAAPKGRLQLYIEALNKANTDFLLNINSETISGRRLISSYYIPEGDREEVTAQFSPLEERAISGTYFYETSVANIAGIFFPPETEPEYTGSDFAEILDSGRWGNMELWASYRDYATGELIELVFRATDRNGMYYNASTDTVWPIWDARTGPNAWIALSLAHSHKKQYGYEYVESTELRVAERIGQSLIKMQNTPNGAVRYELPLSGDVTLWNTVSTEHNISAYAAFRALYEITGKEEYKTAMDNIESYLSSVAVYNPKTNECYFQLGGHFTNGVFEPDDTYFAADCQDWAVLCLGPDKIKEIFHNAYGVEIDAPYLMWRTTKDRAGIREGGSASGELMGLSIYGGMDTIITEQTAWGVMTALLLSDYYKDIEARANELLNDAWTMRTHMEMMRETLATGASAYPYADKTDYDVYGNLIPPRKVLSAIGTASVVFCNDGRNLFYLEAEPIPLSRQVTREAALEAQRRKAEGPEQPVEPTQEYEEIPIVEGVDGIGPDYPADCFFCYKNSPPDISAYSKFRFEFGAEHNGSKIVIRFLSQGADYGSDTGIARDPQTGEPRVYTIENGAIIVNRDEIPLTDSQLRNLKQISGNSGSVAWYINLYQSSDKRVVWSRIIGLKPKASSSGTAGTVIPAILQKRNTSLALKSSA